MDGILATLDGRLEDAISIGQKGHALSDDTGLSVFGTVMDLLTTRTARIYVGRVNEVVELCSELYSEDRKFMYVNYLAHLGHTEEVNQILDSIMKRPGITADDNEFHAYFYVQWLEAAVVIKNRQAVESLLPCLVDSAYRTFGFYYPTSLYRHLGGAAALLGRYDEARQNYQEAIKVCTEMPFRPELALSKLQLAELLLEHYPDEKKEALEHLDFAIKEFREMKMQPSLERALRHKDILKA
jgi:tetratricopeptide (TPR) repeat protein